MIINLHRTNTTNVGDLMSAPSLYFEALKDVPRLELLGFQEAENKDATQRAAWKAAVSGADTIIVGGGGLLGIDFFRPGLEYLFRNKKPSARTVFWGGGHNDWRIEDWRKQKFRIDLGSFRFDLVGVRDAGQPYAWVPCASCLSDVFDRAGPAEVEIGLYVHSDSLKNERWREKLPSGVPMLSNNSSFEEAISFLARSDIVLTDSYHGAYWATLLGRRVIAFPSSSKFYDLKHPVPLCDPEDWARFTRLATRYPEALEECREANRQFAERVLNL